MHCVGNPIAQNAEYVFEGCRRSELRVEFDAGRTGKRSYLPAPGRAPRPLTLKNIGSPSTEELHRKVDRGSNRRLGSKQSQRFSAGHPVIHLPYSPA